MEKCVPADKYPEAVDLFNSEGFFRNLPAMDGGVNALKTMLARGYEVLICTAPQAKSRFCAQEKWEWVREHLGEDWLRRLIITVDKTSVRGDVLIDDKPLITGIQQPVWSHIVFEAPYNREIEMHGRRRLKSWNDWVEVLTEELTALPEVEEDEEEESSATTRSESSSFSPLARKGSQPKLTAKEVSKLRDFSNELQGTSYFKDYQSWRKGAAKGSKGEYWQAVAEIEHLKKQMFLEGDDWSSVHAYRSSYQSWRKGKARGAQGEVQQMPIAAAAFLDNSA